MPRVSMPPRRPATGRPAGTGARNSAPPKPFYADAYWVSRQIRTPPAPVRLN